MNDFPNLHAIEKVLQNEPAPVFNYTGPVQVGVDLGTAYIVILVLTADQTPLAGIYQFSQVVKDGLVVDFMGAVDLVSHLKSQLEEKLGFELTHAATAYPPGVNPADRKAFANVLYAAGFECRQMLDEPSAANLVLNVQNGAVVDIGGGTTGIAIVKDGEVIYTADEATGGTHFSLVIAGANNISFEEAETLKKEASQQRRLYPLVEPVMEKVGTIIQRHVANYPVKTLYLVGGSSNFTGFSQVVERITSIPTLIPPLPMFITPLGIALSDQEDNT